MILWSSCKHASRKPRSNNLFKSASNIGFQSFIFGFDRDLLFDISLGGALFLGWAKVPTNNGGVKRSNHWNMSWWPGEAVGGLEELRSSGHFCWRVFGSSKLKPHVLVWFPKKGCFEVPFAVRVAVSPHFLGQLRLLGHRL